jgi:tetratricopeptide (TPR) repeat protein
VRKTIPNAWGVGMKTESFSTFRKMPVVCIISLILFSLSSCLSPIDMLVSDLIDRKTNEAVEKAVEPALKNYEAQTNAYASAVASINPSSYAMYDFLIGPSSDYTSISSLGSFTPIPMDIPLPSEKEKKALAEAIASVNQDKSSEPTEQRSPMLMSRNSYDRATLLAYAATSYYDSVDLMDSMDKQSLIELNRILVTTPDFSGRSAAPQKARDLSNSVGMAILYGDSDAFKVALAAASVAHDPDNPIIVSNFASSLVPTLEQTVERVVEQAIVPDQSQGAEAAEIYRYALSLSAKDGTYSSQSIPILINLGSLLLDMDRKEEAKRSFLAALDIDPSSWDAAVGLASYYWVQGLRLKARAVLEDARLARPAMYSMVAQAEKIIEEEAAAIAIPADAPDEVFEQAIETVASQSVLTAAEFISSMDQNERNKIRGFVEYLSPIGSYTAPDIKGLTQYGALQAMRQPHGFAALADFTESVALFGTKATASYVKDLMDTTNTMGLDIEMQGIDLDDLEAHPERYTQYEKGSVTVSGAENVYAYAADLELQARKAEVDLANNRTASSLQLAATIDPSFIIFQLNPADYVDPTNVLIQRYNMMQYNIKYNLYGAYLYKVALNAYQTVAGIGQQAGYALGDLSDQFGDPDRCPQAVKQWNQICSSYWNQMTSFASVQYMKKIKPYAEAFYHDVFRHVALISDPGVRERKDRELRSTIDQAVLMGLEAVLMAYGAFDYFPQEEVCKDDQSRIKEIEVVEEQRKAKNNYEKKRFESGDIPPSSPLFKMIDSYGTDLDIPFVPISGRISCARTDLKLGFDMPFKGNPGFDYQYTQNNFTGKSMHEGSLSYRFGGERGDASIDAKVSLTGQIGFNGDGTVADYGFGASGEVTASYKGASATITGSVTGGSGGMDFSGDASASITTTIPQIENLEVEVAVQRDGSLTIDPQIAFNPIGDLMGEAAQDTVGPDGAPFIPTDLGGLKKVFSGKFEL